MFKKSGNIADVKKSQLKCIDSKRDTPTRLKHLKTVFENGDLADIKNFLEVNYSPVFHVFYESFIATESSLKQKATFAVQRSHPEELECCLFILEKILCLLPELLRQRWQCHAFTHIFRKLLHSGNNFRLRRESMRLYILWYMVVGENKSAEMDRMFASLVPTFPVPPQAIYESEVINSKCVPIDPSPVIAATSGEKLPEDVAAFMLKSMLDAMVSQVRKVEWKEKPRQYLKSFSYLLKMFRLMYLPYIFPNLNSDFSIYKPSLDLPELRSTRQNSQTYATCQVVLVEWVKKFVGNPQVSRRTEPASGSFEDGRRSAHSGDIHDANSFVEHDSLVLSYRMPDDSVSLDDYRFVRDFLFSTRENVNFVHEIFRQALRLSFRHASTMKEVVLCYHEWIKMNSQDIPSFMLEPDGDQSDLDVESNQPLKAIISDRDAVRAGLQNILQVFVTSASNVFLLVVPEDFPRLLDEQVDLCKLVLNIYRYMVMHTRMERRTWEQLLVVLFHITSLTLKSIPSASKVDTLGGRFASALFRTLVVSCIKANLSVVISSDLWDQLLGTLQGLTHWDELIKEWAKTMETLTKVLARHVYGLELSNLPLERMTERKALKRAATKLSDFESAKNTLTKGWNIRKVELAASEEGKYCDALSRKEGRPHMSHLSQIMDQSTYKAGFSRSPFTQKRRSSYDSSSSYCRPGGSITDGYSRSYMPRPNWKPRRKLHRSYSDPWLNKRNLSYWENTIPFSRSLDNLLGGDYDSRCPSPTSSGLDAVSLKESPVPIDIGGDTTSIDTLDECASSEQRSVMAGGSVRGWLPDVAVVLWRRVLGILGDPNQVEDPAIHELIFNYLLSLSGTLVKLRDNLGISVDNQSTPEPPELVPPLTLLSSWCFEAFDLPPKYNKGKLLAYRLLCRVAVRKHDLPLSKEFISSFYQCLHQALVGSDREVINTLVFECGPYFFSLGLPGSTMLTLDFICATSSVISSSDPKTVSPRMEALGLLGSLFPLASLYTSMPVLQPTPTDFAMMNCADVRDHLLNTLLKSGKRDSHLKTRCLALSILAVWLYHELARKDRHAKVIEIVNVLMGSLKAGRLASQVAADLLLLLTDYADTLLLSYAELPPRIVQVLCQTLAAHCGDVSIGNNKESQYIVISMVFCLAEWVMRLPQYILVQPVFDGRPILHLVFKVLNYLSLWVKPSATDLRAMGMSATSTEVKDEMSKSASNVKLNKKSNTYADPAAIKLASRYVTNHLVNQLWHFPLGGGAQRLSSMVVEADDLPGQTGEDLTTDIFLSPHVQFFTLNGTCLLSLVQLPAMNVPGGASTAGFKTPNSEVRLIMRDLSGKFSWDASVLYAPPVTDYTDSYPSASPELMKTLSSAISSTGDLTSSIVITTPPRHAVRHRQPDRLPTLEDSADDLDNLDDLISYISHTSPEIVEISCATSNSPLSAGGESQHEAISTILNQRNAEKEYQTINTNHPSAYVPREQPPTPVESDSVFQQCRKFIDHLGLDSFERRKSISTLRKNEKLLRELKNLDNQKCRETHKVAVIYVAEGQEDKSSILANNAGSESFEEFVGGLGWEVELATHTGFLGGLQRNGMTGETAPYFATSLTEAIFHVSTRMPSHTDENLFQKVRHLGNDEVHVVWSEHTRDYRRGIIQTEFCDVLIAIYPMSESLCRINISTKSDIPFFGPLFNGSIVNKKVVSPLVRATALNASRAKRSKLPYYQNFYEERSRALATIIENHSESTSFEKFVSAVYNPFSLNSFGSGGLARGYGSSSQGVSQSGLTAALLDGPGQSSPRPPLSRPTSYSVGEKHNMREKVRNALGTDSPPRIGETTSPSLRGGKKQSMKITRGIHSPIAPPRRGRDILQPNNYKDK